MAYYYNPKGFKKNDPRTAYRRVDKISKGKVVASYGVMIPTTAGIKPVIYEKKRGTDTNKMIAIRASFPNDRDAWGGILIAARMKKERPKQFELL